MLVVLLGLWSPKARFAVGAATLASLLTAIGAWLSPSGLSPWMAAVNRPSALLAIWVTALGIARYKHAERVRLHEQRQARAYLDIAAVPILALDSEDRVLLVNPRASELVGRAVSQIVGRDWLELSIPEGERQQARELLAALRAERLPAGSTYATRVVTAAGQERLVEWRVVATHDAKGAVDGTLLSGEDTTERRRVEGLMRSVVESAPLTLLAVDRVGAIVLAEGRGLRQLGFEPVELLGHASGERFWGLPWLAQPLERALAGHSSAASGERAGATYDVRATPLMDASAKVVGALAVALDVSDRVRAEVALRRQEALAQLGALAAMVAHEVRNPLAGIRATVQVLAKRLPTSDLETIQALFARIDALTEMTAELLAFARPRPLQLGRLPLRSLLQDAARLLTRDRRWSSISVEIAGDDISARADVVALRGVFLNLLLNAAEAMGGRGTIQASIASTSAAARVVVVDAGPGVPANLRAKVFEPFFTTKHRGTGLGLAMVRRQVEQHGGNVFLECPSEGGTRVTVSLPLDSSGAQKSPPDA